MPTGYTAGLYEGEQSFEDFVLGCARAFGAAVLMRDNPASEPISIEAITDKSDYHVRGLKAAVVELGRLEKMTTAEIEREAELFNKERIESDERHTATRLEMRGRYQAMLDQVREWEPPSEEHAEFKTFMIEQLQGSIDFDTKFIGKISAPLTPDEWYAQTVANRRRDITYHIEEDAKRIERNEGRTRWVTQLWESLGISSQEPEMHPTEGVSLRP